MKNLTKNLLLAIVIFSLLISLSFVFAEKVVAVTIIPCGNWNTCESCIAIGTGRANDCGWGGSDLSGDYCQSGTSSCSFSYTNWRWYSCSTNVCAAPTPTPIPCSNWNNCSNCIAVGTGRANNCGWKNGSTCQSGTLTCPIGAASWNYSSCSQDQCFPTPTPTRTPTPTTPPTPTPTRTPTPTTPPTPTPTPPIFKWTLIASCNVQAPTPTSTTTVFQTNCPTSDIGRCGAGTPPFSNCTGLLYSAGTPISNCTTDLPNCWSCPLPTPTATPTPTRTPTPTPNLFTCANQTGPAAGNYQCATIINGVVQCPSEFGDFSPSSPYTGTSCTSSGQGCCKQGATTQADLFTCQNQTTGTYAGSYICADIVNGATQCPDNFIQFQIGSPYTGTSCGATRGCCKQNAPTATPIPTGIPTATPTVTPTPLPGSVQLALTLTQQGLTDTPVNRSRPVTVLLKGADDQLITKTGTADYSNGTFNGTINLGVLPAGSYKLKVEVGNFLKSLIGDAVISGTAASAQTTVVAGLTDQFNDNVDAISFYANGLRTCFGSTIGIKKCSNPDDVDLNGDANVDPIDYQIYLKGIRDLQQGLPVQ